jgi:hypothetical protein
MTQDDFLARRARQLQKQAEHQVATTRRSEAVRTIARCIRHLREAGLADEEIAKELWEAASELDGK